MPSAPAVPMTARPRNALAIRLMRLGATLLILLVALACTLLLVVRFLVFPRIENWHDDIAGRLSSQLGQQVEIDRLAAGWDGWNPKLVVSGLRVRDRAVADAPPLLELPQVEFVVSWTSLVFADLVLRELVIDRPRLAIRRDGEGHLSVAGIEVGEARTGGDGRVAAWLLRQHSIVIRNALITWDDQKRNAPQLVLDRVQFRLEQELGVHRFGLTGVPPADLASPLDLRGEWSGAMGSNWRQAKGRLYVRFDYVDVVPLREWLPLPAQLESGKGALRFWFDFGNGVAQDAVADVELADVRVRLKVQLPPIEMRHLAGHLEWKEEGPKRTLTARGLEFSARDGTALAPTDGAISVEQDAEARITGGQVRLAALDLVPLAALAAHLPLPESWRDNIGQLAPRGTIRNVRYEWQGPSERPAHWLASGAFNELAVSALGPFPGVSAVTGTFETTESKGTIKLSERPATIALPRVFEEALGFGRLRATTHWERRPEGIVVRIEEFAFANAHAAGSLSGRWQAADGGPGTVDLSGTVSRVDLAHVWRYTPVARAVLRDWMQRAFVKGTASEGKFMLTGALGQSPFQPGTAARLVVAAKIQGGSLDYARNWPGATDIDGELRIDGRRLTFAATRGQVFGVKIDRALMEIPELRAPGGSVLRLDLDATGPTTEFLEFIARSPVTNYIGGANAGVQATGDGALALKLELGLARQKPPEVAGEYTFLNNQLRTPTLPLLSEVNGKIAFTEKGVQAQDVAAQLLGGAAKFSIAKADERTRISGSGTVNLGLLRTQMPFPMSERLSGTSDWQFAATLLPKFVAWQLDSSLKGATIDLPAPIGKLEGDATPLRIERRMRGTQTDRDTVTVDIRNTARLIVQRRLAGSEAKLERALFLVGKATERPGDADRSGIWVRADVASLNVDEWLGVVARERARGTASPAPPSAAASTSPTSASASAPALEGFELDAARLDAAGRRFRDARITARYTADEWRMVLNSGEIAGTAVWRGATATVPNGRLVARLSRFTVPSAKDLVKPAGTGKEAAPARDATASNWPELDIVSEALLSNDRDLGRLEVLAKPAGPDWRIDKLAISNDAGSVVVNGLWRPSATAEQTKLDVMLDAKDAGQLLTRFGYAGAVVGAPTKIEGQLAWNGPPSSIDFPTLGGNFRIVSGAGHFTKVDPGIGKLIGVLSLQALPRRLTLDFTDVFSEGFAFDEITGGVRIQTGIMRSDDLKITGPAARVDISGETDLGNETQKLTVKVVPGFSAGTAALLLAANPLVAAAVGAGMLLAQSMGANPLDHAFSYEYSITGGWTNPVVTRVQAAPITLPGDGTGR